MRTRWLLAATWLGTLAGLSACARGEELFPAWGATGEAGPGVMTTGVTTTASASSAGSTGGGGSGGTGEGGAGGVNGPSLCGNGVLDPGEACDGADFGGLTCALLGFSSGSLTCDTFCVTDVTGCLPVENCSNGLDDDGNGLVDCQDPACAGAATCADSCTPTASAGLPGFGYGTTTGRVSAHKASCSAGSGPEIMFQVVSPIDGLMRLTLDSAPGGPDFSISVRTACDDDGSEIACENQQGAGSSDPEILAVQVTAGTTYFVMVDGNQPGDFGDILLLELDVRAPESDCVDLVDNDGNGYVDCDDPSCQALPACTPGATAAAAGQPCLVPSDCQADHDDPVCLSAAQGFPGGYCSEFCDAAAQDCAPGALCWTGLSLSVHGVCLQACAGDADCAMGFSCVDEGLASPVCALDTGPEKLCDDYLDNDGDGLLDCQDPSSCQSLPACAPGPGAAGQPCTANHECAANHNDPICLDQAHLGFAGGYCSQFCEPSPDDCGPAGVCAGKGPGNAPVCLQACNTTAECRSGYSCLDLGYARKVCF